MTTYRSLIFLLTEVIKAVSPQRLLVCLHVSPQPSQLPPKQKAEAWCAGNLAGCGLFSCHNGAILFSLILWLAEISS